MEQLLTVKEACAYLKVARPTLYKYMDRGVRGVRLAFVNVGATRRISQSAIDTFIRESTAAGVIADDDRMGTQISASGPVAAFAG
jgi:excisionase family DNA binding protein